MTPYSFLASASGMSTQELSVLHSTLVEDVKIWILGESAAPEHCVDQIYMVVNHIETTVQRAMDFIETMPSHFEIVLGYPENQNDAVSLGFPCISAWKSMAGRVIVRCDREVIFTPMSQSRDSFL